MLGGLSQHWPNRAERVSKAGWAPTSWGEHLRGSPLQVRKTERRSASADALPWPEAARQRAMMSQCSGAVFVAQAALAPAMRDSAATSNIVSAQALAISFSTSDRKSTRLHSSH